MIQKHKQPKYTNVLKLLTMINTRRYQVERYQVERYQMGRYQQATTTPELEQRTITLFNTGPVLRTRSRFDQKCINNYHKDAPIRLLF